jgi:hypothetical protein
MIRAIIIVVVSMLAFNYAACQSDTTQSYTIETLLTVGIKETRYAEATTQYSDRQIFPGITVKGRVYWFPNHHLGVGIQSGYELFSKEEFTVLDSTLTPTSLVMQLSGVPIHLAFEMRPSNFRLGVGLGVYLLTSRISRNGIVTKSSDLAFGVSALVGYELHLLDRIHIGPEIGLYIISDRSIVSVAPSITLRYDFQKY